MFSNGFMEILAVIVVLGNASLAIIFNMMREKVKYEVSRVVNKIHKLCIIGICISLLIMNAGLFVLLLYIHL